METILLMIVAFVAGAAALGLIKKKKEEAVEENEIVEPVENKEVQTPSLEELWKKQNLLFRRYDVGQGENNKEEMPKSSALLLCELLEHVEVDNSETPQKMIIDCDGEIEEITDEYKILSFDVREYLKAQPKGKDIKNLLLHVNFETFNAVFTLARCDEYTDHTRYYRFYGFAAQTDRTHCLHNSTIEVRFTDSDQDYWEAKYMIDEAIASQGGEKQYSDETLAAMAFINPSIANDLYWARKYYTTTIGDNGDSNNATLCLVQALFFYRRIYQGLCASINNLTDEAKNILLEANACIGRIYMIWGQYEKAYHYLEFALQSNNISDEMAFIDCMFGINHAFVENQIKKVLNRLLNQVSTHEPSKGMFDFEIRQLKRQLIRAYLMHEQYSEAELEINRMQVNEEEDPEYIANVLQYIANARNSQQGNQSTETTSSQS